MKFAFDIATHLLLEMEVEGITEEVKSVVNIFFYSVHVRSQLISI